MSDQDVGTLYVLSNLDQSLAKIGLTRNGTPDARASDYERKHGITWRVFWQARTERVAGTEAAIHHELAAYRFSLTPEAREVFHIVPARAVAVAQRFVVPPAGAQPDARTTLPPWRSRIERIAAVAVLLITLLPAVRRLTRHARLLVRELRNPRS